MGVVPLYPILGSQGREMPAILLNYLTENA
jgi:hypothetical protein